MGTSLDMCWHSKCPRVKISSNIALYGVVTSDSRVQSSENTGTRDTGFEGSVTNGDPIQVQLARIASGLPAILTKIRENHEDLKGKIVREVTKVREDVFLELASWKP